MRNKQKAWRKMASSAKLAAIEAGTHERGQRYGRWHKAVFLKVPPFVSPLMLALRARFWKENLGLMLRVEDKQLVQYDSKA
jgi:hypothetical protein